MKAYPKDITVQTMTKRHIGVENELGVRCEAEAIEAELDKRGLLHSIGWDGGGREFRTNPIAVHTLKQVRGFRYFTEYYGVLKKNTAVIETGGTHIHISILNDDHKNLEANVTAMGVAFYTQFQKIAGRKSSWASRRNFSTLKQVQDEISCIQAFNRDKKNRLCGMKGGMIAPTYHQTFEFRGPKGSNDSEEILAWVEFLNNIVTVCNRESIEGIPFKRLLRTKRVSAYVKSLEDWRKLTKSDLEQRFNGAKLR